MTSEIIGWSAVETADRVARRAVSVTEVISAHLDRIAAVNPGINAVTEVDDSSLEIARRIDAAPLPDDLPPLLGVPVTSKINTDQTGFSNSNGIPAQAGNICDQDSAVVANLKSAGAIVIGRTNTPEFSLRWFTSNPLYGVTSNPWDANATPGGSSGGAAASVAMGIGSIAHGNDLGGSLRYPAYCCGVASIRPSLGRIPAFNPSAGEERPPLTMMMSTQGPIARSIADVRLGLRAMAQRDSRDPQWSGATNSGRRREGQITIGFATNPFSAPIHPGVEQAMATACDGLRAAGHRLVETVPPQADLLARLWGDMLFTETEYALGPAIREAGSAEMNRLTDGFMMYYQRRDLQGFLAGLAQRLAGQRAWAQMFDDIDLLLMPTSLVPPFDNDQDFVRPETLPQIIAAQAPLFVINVLGLPSVAVPTGLADGRPVGVQLVGPMHDDAFALDVAESLEAQIGRLSDRLLAAG